jgi:hypothetical protein
VKVCAQYYWSTEFGKQLMRTIKGADGMYLIPGWQLEQTGTFPQALSNGNLGSKNVPEIQS